MPLITRFRSVLLLTLLAWSAPAGTITNFQIVNSSNPNVPGGVWDPGGSYTNYAGSFSFDLSQIPVAGSFSVPIPTFQFSSTGPGLTLTKSSALSDAATLSGNFLADIGGVNEYLDVLSVDKGVWTFDFLEPQGTFHGGLIVTTAIPTLNLTDTHGTALTENALIVSPTVAAPEPGTLRLFSIALIAGGIMFRRKRAKSQA